MTRHLFLTLALTLWAAAEAHGQRPQIFESTGEVSRKAVGKGDVSRLAPRVPGLPAEMRARLQVSGDSAQRIALHDFDWRGRVSSIEVDEDDVRVFWDVKIVPDSTSGTLVRYRVDGRTGGILEIREFTGIRGLARRRP
ncbi:MAG TPA: hypothetical protein VEB19_16050 [Gemmatimonadaceae bacterium]|nr:hypothetical protein [Gemmatimonadaceae bacterium]